MTLELRQAWRGLMRNPLVAVAAVGALMLGVGANVAVFGVVRDLVLRPLPYRQAEDLVVLWGRLPDVPRAGLAPADFFSLRREARTIAEIAAAAPYGPTLAGADGPERVAAMSSTANLFSVLGVEAVTGRVFGAADDQSLAVLDHGFWQRRYGGRPEVVGTKVRLDGEPVEVVGVLPRDFSAPWGRPVDLWVLAPDDVPRAPIEVPGDARAVRGLNYLWTVARSADGEAAVHEELATLSSRYGREFPDTNRQLELYALSLRRERARELVEPLAVLSLAALAVLLLALVDVAMVLLARASARSWDDAVRCAVGAGRLQLTTVAVWEGMLLAAAGTAGGMALALPAAKLLVGAAPVELPGGVTGGLDAATLGFAAAAALLVAVGVAALPAWWSGNADPAHVLAAGGRAGEGRRARRLRSALVALQSALALMLLTGAVFLGRAFVDLTKAEPGFTAAGVLTARVDLPAGGEDPTGRVASTLRTALGELRAQPEVEAAGTVAALPLSGSDGSFEFWVEGRAAPPPGEVPLVGFRVADEGYFETLRIPIVAGRNFGPEDHEQSAPAVLVNRALARAHLADGEAVGRRLRFRSPDPTAEPYWFTIVGVVGDVHHAGLDEPPRPEIYLNAYQMGWTSMAFVVRTAGEPAAAAPAVTRALARADPGLPLHQVRTLDSYRSDSLALRRYLLALVGVAASIALLLAAVGMYGVVAYDVARSRRETGVRVALGAGSWRVLRSSAGPALAAVAVGCALGGGASIVATRLLADLFPSPGSTSLPAVAATAALLAAVAAAAATVPARRALSVPVVDALRDP